MGIKALALTNSEVGGLAPPRDVPQYVVRDTKSKPALYLRVGKRRKTFYIQRYINGVSRSVDIGRFGEITVEQARKRASVIHAEIANDNYDPDARKRRVEVDRTTVQQALDAYIADKQHITTERTFQGYRTDIKALGWSGRKLCTITEEQVKRHVQTLCQTISPKTAKSAFKTLNMLFRHIGHTEPGLSNPVGILYRQGLVPKTKAYQPRFQSDKDWARAMLVASAYTSPVLGDAWWVQALTGLRPTQEVWRMRWERVDFDSRTITITPDDLKAKDRSKRPDNLVIPITEPLQEILERRYLHSNLNHNRLTAEQRGCVFPSRWRSSHSPHLISNGGVVKAVEEAMGYDICNYSLRRFYVTKMRILKIDKQIRFALLDHGHGGDIQDGEYDELTVDDLREDAERIAAHLIGLVASVREVM